jgi:hypothetical protein
MRARMNTASTVDKPPPRGHPVCNEKKTLEYIRHRLIGMGSILLLAVQGKKRNARGKGLKTCFGRVEENVSAKSSIF